MNTVVNVLRKEWKSGLRNTAALESSSEELVALASTTSLVVALVGLAIHASILAALVANTLARTHVDCTDISVALVREQVDGDNQQKKRT